MVTKNTGNKNKIIYTVITIILIISGVLIYSFSNENITYYHNVNEIIKEPDKYQGKRIRVLGLVETGSSNWNPEELALNFTITEDGSNFLNISFQGVKPDLYREGQGVVAEGVLSNNKLLADQLLVKHSPEYRVEDHDDKKEKYLDYIKTIQ